MTRSVYTLCGFQNFKPVGFCVVCAFCGNYKQRRYKYKSLSPINCNLQFYHSKFWMNLFWLVPDIECGAIEGYIRDVLCLYFYPN